MAKVPGLGEVPKPVLIIGGIGGVAVTAYLYMKHKAAASQAAATPPAAGYGYGYGYGAYGYSNPAFAAASTPYEYGYGAMGYGYYGYGGEFAGLGGYGSPYPVTSTATAATTNAGWAEAAETYLAGQTGANPATVAAALGKYITGASVTSDQEAIIQQAIAFEGYPPDPGPNNYPPSIKTTGTSGQTGTTTAGTKTVEADGKQDLSQFAHAHGTTGGKLILLKGNKWLTGYYGNTRKIPKGYKVTVSG